MERRTPVAVLTAILAALLALSADIALGAERTPRKPGALQFGGSGGGIKIRPGVDPGAPVLAARTDEVVITANEGYLGSSGSLKFAYDRKRQTERAPTHARFRSHFRHFCEDGSSCDWGVVFAAAGEVRVTPIMKVGAQQGGRRLLVVFTPIAPDNRRGPSVSASLQTTPTGDAFGAQPSVGLTVPAPGFYEVSLKSSAAQAPADRGREVGDVKALKLSGPAVVGARCVTIRSPRTGAVHGRFSAPGKIVLAVIETRIATPDQPGQYFPVTTPFGYFGSTWRNAEQRFGGANFSMWSDRKASKAGDIPKLSRLIAYRADSTYTTFGHEGIGVKPIGRNPWLDMKPTPTQVLAMRKEPGIAYDTYTGYFLNLDTGQWELFACGRKYNRRKKIIYLNVRGFMEVLYPSPHRRRQADRRGWYMTQDGKWIQITSMRHGAYKANKNWSHRDYEITPDGWFAMATGGWYPNDIARGALELPQEFRVDPEQRPAYLKGDKLRQILELPIVIEDLPPIDILRDRATIRFNIRKGDLTGKAIVYYGLEDKATFCHDMNDRHYAFVAKWKWKQHKTVSGARLGENQVTLSNLKSGVQYFYRIRVFGKTAQVWNDKTGRFRTE